MIACRVNFDAVRPDASDEPIDGPIDAPPVPISICKVDRIPFASMPATADLAITGTSEGYAAVWVDPSGATQAQGVLLQLNHQFRSRVAIPAIRDTQLGGITDVGQKLVLSSGDGVSQTTWILGRDLTVASPESKLESYVMAHGQYPSDSSQSPRVFVTATGTTLTTAYIADDGLINPDSTVSRDTTGRVTDLACADGPDHAHCVWAEAVSTINGASQCTGNDVRLRPVPAIPPGGPVLSGDCYNVRTSSGPDLADSQIIVWTTAAHSVEGRYVDKDGVDIARSITAAGSAPKVQFDGIEFWIAWLDGQDVLQLASFDVRGKIVSYSLAGWAPLGPEAFELVRRGNQTAVVLLSRDGLEILTICS
jgi:hypothetical protein